MSDDDVNVKFGADTAGATAAINQLRETMAGVAEPVSKLMAAFSELKEALVATFAVDQAVEFIEHMAELGTQTERTMAILGISSKEVGEFSLMAAESGGTMQAMTMSLERLQVNLGKATSATSPAGQALKALGLNAKDLIGIPIPAQMDKIAEAMSKFGDGGNKTAIAIALLGRGGAQMIPILDKGKAGLDDIRASASNAAVSLSEDTVKGLASVHAASVTLSASLAGLGAAIVAAFSTSLRNGISAMTDTVSAMSALIQTGGVWQATLKELQFTWDFWIAGMRQNAVFLKNLFTLNWGAIQSDWKAGTSELEGVATDHWNELLRQAGAAKLKLKFALDIKPETAKPQPGSLGDTGDSAAAAQKELEAEIKVLQTGLQQKKALLEQEVALHQITEAQKFQSLQNYTDDAYDDERELLTQELSLWAQGTTQYAAVKAKLLELDAKYALDSQKVATDATKAQVKSYQDMFNAVEGAFNSQLKGLLAGTTTWASAFKSILGDLIIKFIEAVEKMGFEWLAGELAKTAATTAGVAARTGAEAAGAAAGSAITIESAVKSIMSSAAQTFAGIFAFLSPVMGPAAAGPATAGEAVVAAQTVAAYAQGTPWVPNDGYAFLHRGEAVVPAAANAAGLGGGGGGGDTHVHFNINGGVNDGASLAKFFRNNANLIASSLQRVNVTPRMT